MPSLRRTLSSPSVRSSPYSNGTVVARGSGHRRSSGSETTNRRVLADIEWWKVTDGQCDTGADQESEDRNRGGDQDVISPDVSLGLGIHITQVDAGDEHPLPMPLPWISSFTGGSIEHTLPPTEQFSSLSIAPHTPTHRHLPLESSSSSLESSPESAGTPLEGLGLRLLDMGIGTFPTFLDKHSRAGTLAPVTTHAFTFADCLSMKDGQATQYADFAVSPLSSSPNFLN